MNGQPLARRFLFGALVAALALGGCKNDKPSSTPTASPVPVSLEGTRWVLVELEGRVIASESNDKAPYIQLKSETAALGGFTGCNRLHGSYTTSGQSLAFAGLGMTRKACTELMAQENDFVGALGSVSRYEIQGSELLLMADEALVARFEVTGVKP